MSVCSYLCVAFVSLYACMFVLWWIGNSHHYCYYHNYYFYKYNIFRTAYNGHNLSRAMVEVVVVQICCFYCEYYYSSVTTTTTTTTTKIIIFTTNTTTKLLLLPPLLPLSFVLSLPLLLLLLIGRLAGEVPQSHPSPLRGYDDGTGIQAHEECERNH